jgi:GNAT superfamily N-acetyltransferase
MQFMDLDLARRAEFAEAAACRECAEAYGAQHREFPVAVAEIGGAVACFAGTESPVSQAIGFGLNGKVEDSDFDRLTEFFHSRNAPAAAEICPFVDMSLYEKFASRGYRLLEVSNVLIKQIAKENAAAAKSSEAFAIRPAQPDEAKLWTRTVAQGFAEHFPVTPEMLDVMEGFFLGKNSRPFLALVDGEAAGGAAMTIHDGVCGLFGASTLPAHRGRGIQTALLAARIAVAANEGCDLAVSIAQPGSISHRNIERGGFRVAYTRTKLIRPLAP